MTNEQEKKEIEKFGNTFWGFFLNRFRITLVFIIAIIILGINALISLPREAEPEVKVPVAVITTAYPGASPIDVEKLITDKLENKLEELDNIDKITSSSFLGISSIIVQFAPKSDLTQSIRDVRDKTDEAKKLLPTDTEDPIVTEVSFNNLPIVVFSLIGNLSTEEFEYYAKLTQKELEDIRGVSEARILGLKEKEIQVNIKNTILEGYYLTLSQIINAISSNHINTPIGTVEIGEKNYQIRLEGEYKTADELKTLPIANISNENIFLGDIAEINEVYGKETVLSKFSSMGKTPKKTLAIVLYKHTGGNILRIVGRAKEKLKELKQKKFPKTLDIEVTSDNSEFIREDFSTLGRNAIQTTIIIIIMLFLALSFKEALIAGLAIPFTFLIAFTVIRYQGGTLNSLVLFSLVLALGLMVDTSIVIMEGIHENMMSGKYTAKESALFAIKTYRFPIMSGTLTTVAAFVPMLFVSGIMGEFLKHIPITISAALLASLIVSLTISPALAAQVFCRRCKKFIKEPIYPVKTTKREKIFSYFRQKYTLVLKYILYNKKRNKIVFIISIILFLEALSLPLFGIMDTQMFPQVDMDFFTINITAPEGTKLSSTKKITDSVVEILRRNHYIKNFVVSIGGGSLAQVKHDIKNPSAGTARSNTAAITVNLFKKEKRKLKSYKITNNLRKKLKNIHKADIKIEEAKAGPPSGAQIEVRILGNNLNTLRKVSEDIKKMLSEIKGVIDIDDNLIKGAGEFVFKLKKDRLSFYGLSSASVANTLRAAVYGVSAAKIKRGDEDIDIRVKYDWGKDEIPKDISKIESIAISSNAGVSIPVKEIAEISFLPSLTSIKHKDAKRIINVTANSSDMPTAKVFKTLKDKLVYYKKPEDAEIEIGGEREDISQSFSDLFNALTVAIILIAFILILQFNSFSQPLIILFCLPLSLIGVFNGLFFTGFALSFPAFIGIVALAGIVVNDAIVLMDRINTNRKHGMKIIDSVIEAGPSRMKPIFMTSITTIGGILPLVFTNEVWAGLALSIIYGLIFSTALTLIVVPSMYVAIEKRKIKPSKQDQSTKTNLPSNDN